MRLPPRAPLPFGFEVDYRGTLAPGRNGAQKAPDGLVKGTRPFEVAGRGKGREDAREAPDRITPSARAMLGGVVWGPFGARPVVVHVRRGVATCSETP